MLRLTYDDHGLAQDDLLLTFGEHRLSADSYYLALDRNIQPGSRSPGKVRDVLRVLLRQWRDAVENARIGDSFYLPFEFSDQNTGWLHCEMTNEGCVLRPGWSSLEGWNLPPTEWQEFLEELPDFEPESDMSPLTVSREAMLADIDASLGGLMDMAPPPTDPSPLFELFRGNFATELLTAAVCHFDVFRRLKEKRQSREQLTDALGLSDRAGHVLITGLRAMGLLDVDGNQLLHLTPVSRAHLVPDRTYDIGGYIGLAADTPGVKEMVSRLKSGRPFGSDEPEIGTAFVHREGTASAMDRDDAARRLTMSLAGRARNVAPALADRMDLSSVKTLLDVAGGSGLYSIALLRRFPHLQAVILDRAPVLKVAREFAQKFGVSDRLECVPGDMFVSAWPQADAVLLSNVLHDWDVPDCQKLLRRCADRLATGQRLFIHDVLLNDALDGPLPIALYSAALFCLTEGRAYSRREYETWLRDADFEPVRCQPTLVHCHVLEARRR